MGIYCATSDVKIVLKTNRANKIRFNENSIRNVRSAKLSNPIGVGFNGSAPNNNNVLNFNLGIDVNLITIASTFSGFRKIQIYFEDPTNYNVYMSDDINGNFMLIGSSDIVTGFVAPGGEFTLASNCFIGTPVFKDVIYFDLECHVSDDEIEYFIDVAEIEIDSFLLGGRHKVENTLQARIFNDVNLPDQIKTSCSYLAAYVVYTSVFADEQRDFEKSKDVRSVHFTERWKKMVDNNLMQYLKLANRRIPSTYIKYSDVSENARCYVHPRLIDCGTELEMTCDE